jgi:phenylacetate-CoA ligase
MSFFSRPVETMPREHLQAYQLEKLQHLLQRIDGRNRFYARKLNQVGVVPFDIQTMEDFFQLPFTTKAELLKAQADDPPFGTNATFPESAYTRFHQTSGTTGKPLRVLDTAESWEWWGDCWGYVMAAAGVTAADRLFLPFSFGPFIGFWAAVLGAKRIGTLLISGGGYSSIQRLNLMRDMEVTVMCCTPTYALRLAEVARENDFDINTIPLRATIHAGEPGANVPATKKRIEQTWGVKAYDHAGASEVGAYSYECELQPDGIHVNESEFIVEIINPDTGEHVPEGEKGELIITNLGRIGFPIIRYRTGDLVQFTSQPCDCGRTFGRFLGGIIGRADDMIIVRGVNVYPSAVENLVRQFADVDEFRVQISKKKEMAEFMLEVELIPGASPEENCRAIRQTFHNVLGLRPSVTAVARGSLPRFELKSRRFSYLFNE